ncbi:MAG TPA: LD-carboxypeptidase [Cytophagales bacterium]|nr:LD-carboxypeptidase [Cytophagales bacterium]
MRPPHLKRNDKVAFAAPARKIKQEEIAYSIKILESWGLEVVVDERLFRQCNQFGGNDEERIELFQDLLNNKEIKAIICVRGGYGITRIIDRVDFSGLLRNPKWICGYSDVTALLCHLFKMDIEGIHSTMPMLFERDKPESLESLRKILFGEDYSISSPGHSLNKYGVAEGKVVGGNLSILNTLIGTPSDLETSGSILFLEDIDEYLYNIDRMTVQLKRTGKLNNLSGLIVGHMTDMKDNTIPFGSTAFEILHNWTKEYNIPVAFGLPVGHEPENMAIPFGRIGRLKVCDKGASLSFIRNNQDPAQASV